MNPTHNGSTALLRFERSTMIEIRNGVMFNFYLGLPHVCTFALTTTPSSLAGGSRRCYSSTASSCHSLYLHQTHSTQDFCKGHCRGTCTCMYSWKFICQVTWLNLILQCHVYLSHGMQELLYVWKAYLHAAAFLYASLSGLSDNSRLLEDCFCWPSSWQRVSSAVVVRPKTIVESG